MLLTGLDWAGRALFGWPEARLGEALRLLLGFAAALLLWRLGMRLHFTTRRYGWRQGLLALPRAFVANVIALLAARRALVQYCRTLRSGEVIWAKTDHDALELPKTAQGHLSVRRGGATGVC